MKYIKWSTGGTNMCFQTKRASISSSEAQMNFIVDIDSLQLTCSLTTPLS